jgi:L-asparaginase
MQIKLLLTGGTIDKQYNYLTAEMDYVNTHIRQMLKQARSRVDLDIEQLMLLDSLEITETQRQQIVERCLASQTNKVVVTHGTDTIVQTAKKLAGGGVSDTKTVVLVGSMIPYVFKGSDALFNLGAAITAVQLLGPGVFITMNGKIFSWDNVIKNREIGEFQTVLET